MSNPNASDIVKLEELSIRYDTSEKWIGKNLNLTITPGETVLLLGPSGCGKSTILLAMAGLIPASVDADLRGAVYCAGLDTAAVHSGQLAAYVGVVFQDPDAQVVTNTLLDEVCFGLENLLVPEDEIEKRALSALSRVGLATSYDQAKRNPASLSGGQRQRLAIACALALEPELLILDEPTANLDPVAAADFYSHLASLRDGKRALILVEHEIDEVLALADRVVVLDWDGEVCVSGTPTEVFGHHAQLLQEKGVWLPTATEVALRCGFAPDAQGLPLTVEELATRHAAEINTVLAAAPALATPPLNPHVVASLSDVEVTLNKKKILKRINLKIHEGEFLAIAGINGAGKSTLTLALAGLLPISSGEITLMGRNLASRSSRDIGEQIGYVFQNPEHQFVTSSVAAELGYGLRVRGRDTAEIDEAVNHMLRRFELTRYAEVNPFLLSHGEKRRLSVATALITQPEILILDEPTFGQDRARATELISLIDDLNASGTTIVMVTHDIQLIADHAHRVALLKEGELLGVDSTSHMLNEPELIQAAGLRLPPIKRFAQIMSASFPGWESVYRLGQIRQATL